MAQYYYRYKNKDGTYVYLPAQDVEHVVYCKHCSYYDPEYASTYGYCHYWEHEEGTDPNIVEPNDFCSNAIEEV